MLLLPMQKGYMNKPTTNIFRIIRECLGLANQLGLSLVILVHWYIHLLVCATTLFQLNKVSSTISISNTCINMKILYIL